ncbi:MAG: isochorismate synthase [Deltaproteobacteria bacterium]|nr:isochorismate synthase [Deltaproteobacteria bacterium]
MIDVRDRLRRVALPDEVIGDPLDAIARAPGEPAFYWRNDAAGIEIAALGAIRVVETCGPRRFADASRALAALRKELGNAAGDWPLLVGGFAFGDGEAAPRWSDFPPLRFFVPRALWIRQGEVRRLVITYPAGHEQTPASLLAGTDGDWSQMEDVQDGEATPATAAAASGSTRPGDVARATRSTGISATDAKWFARVAEAQRSIRSGRLDKAVLARRRTLTAAAPPLVEPILTALAEKRPECFTFLVRWRGRCFLGSSPERLARVDGRRLDTDALAGSAPRGQSKAHDDAGARELLANDKERREHRIVVDAITEALGPVTSDIELAPEPSVMRLPESLHLHTPIHATLSRPVSLLEAARRLHPTPAVCGAPRAAAKKLLEAEAADRGWYSGAVGWIGANGDGELAVSLRAALLEGRRAHVWAGAGIVEGSDPEREFDETESKMRSMLPYFEADDDECAA